MNRRTIVVLVLVLLLLAGLVGFYLYLAGGQTTDTAEQTKTAEGLIHVRSIYTADDENLRRPTGIGADDNGDFYVTLKDDARVAGFKRNGDFLVKWGEYGLKQGQLLAPLAVVPDRAANKVFVIDRARLRIICYDLNGRFQWERAVLNPVGIARLGDNVAVTTFGPIVLLSSEGEPQSESGSRGFKPGDFDYPRSAVQAPEGEDLIVADTNNTRVQRVELSGEATANARWVTGTPPRFQDDPETVFGVPSGVTVDDRGRTFVLDGFRHKIDVLDSQTGKVIHSFVKLQGEKNGQFNKPTGIVNLGGDFFAISDTYNDRVQIVRLLLPAENNILGQRPWWLWLLPLLLLLLLIPLLRRRVFVTREVLVEAQNDENLRLLASAFRRLHVLPEVADEFATVTEQEVELAPFLIRSGDPRTDEAATDDEARLAKVASPRGIKRLLAPRRLVICADAEQLQRISGATSARVRGYEWVLSEYRIVE